MRFVCHTKCVDSTGRRYRVGEEADLEPDDRFTKWFSPLDEAPVEEEDEGVHEPQTLLELQEQIAPLIVTEPVPEKAKPEPPKKAQPRKPVRRGRK